MPPTEPEPLATRCAQQAREIRALEKIETLLERRHALEAANRGLQVQLAELRTVWALSRTLAATLNPEELLPLALHLLGRALPADAYALFLLDEATRRLTVKGAAGLGAAGLQDRTCGLGEGIAGVVAATGEPQLTAADSLTPGAGLYIPLKLTGGAHPGGAPGAAGHPPALHPPGPGAGPGGGHPGGRGPGERPALPADQGAQRQGRAHRARQPPRLLRGPGGRGPAGPPVPAGLHHPDAGPGRLQALQRHPRAPLVGDQALRTVGRLLLGSTRRADVVARFGGEEFVILLPETLKAAGAVVAEKIRAAVAQHPLPGRESQPGGRLTVTGGVAAYPGDAASGLEVVDAADRALYRGKQQGGNRVVVAPEGE